MGEKLLQGAYKEFKRKRIYLLANIKYIVKGVSNAHCNLFHFTAAWAEQMWKNAKKEIKIKKAEWKKCDYKAVSKRLAKQHERMRCQESVKRHFLFGEELEPTKPMEKRAGPEDDTAPWLGRAARQGSGKRSSMPSQAKQKWKAPTNVRFICVHKFRQHTHTYAPSICHFIALHLRVLVCMCVRV